MDLGRRFGRIVVLVIGICLQTTLATRAQSQTVTWLSSPVAGSTPTSSAASAMPLWQFIGPKPINNVPDYWSQVQASGRVTAISHDQTYIWVGTSGGGVWATNQTQNNSNPRWIPLFDSEPTLSIGSMDVDATVSPHRLYVGTGEGNFSSDSYYGLGVFRSDDLGQTWTQHNAFSFQYLSIPSLHVHGNGNANQATVFAGVGPAYNTNRAYVPSNVPSNYANMGFWRSTDSGSTWSQYAPFSGCLNYVPPGSSTGGPNPAMSIVTDSTNSKMLVSLLGCGVFKATDNPYFNSWTKSTFNDVHGNAIDQTTFGRTTLAFASNDNTRVYAIVGAADRIEYRGFFKSTDGGTTFNQTTGTPGGSFAGSNFDGTSNLNISQSIFDQALIVSPYAEQKIVFGGVALWESTDAGNSWSLISNINQGTHVDTHALDLDPNSSPSLGAIINVGNDGGISRFNLSTQTNMFSLNQNLPVTQMQGISTNPGLAFYSLPGGVAQNQVLGGTQDNQATQNTSSGLVWSAVQDIAGDGGFTQISQLNPSFQYHTGSQQLSPANNAIVYDSVNGGSSFAQSNVTAAGANELTAFYPPVAVDPGNAQHILFGDHYMYSGNVAGNGSISWTTQSTSDLTGGCQLGRGCAIDDVQFAPSNANVAYALSTGIPGAPFHIMYTGSATGASGVTWYNITGSPPFSTVYEPMSIAVSPSNPYLVYVAFSDFGFSGMVSPIYQGTVTVSNGVPSSVIWQPLGGNGLPSVSVTKILVDKNDSTGNSLIAGTDIGAFRSFDGGHNWFYMTVLPATPVFDLFQNSSGLIVAGTHGRGAWQLSSFSQLCRQLDAANISISADTAVFDYFASIGFTPENTEKTTCTANTEAVYLANAGVALTRVNGVTLVTSFTLGSADYAVDTNYNVTQQIGSVNQILIQGLSCLDLSVPGGNPTCSACDICPTCSWVIIPCDDCPGPGSGGGIS